MRRPFIAGNWKMHKTDHEAYDYIQELQGMPWDEGVEAAIIPPFTCLHVFKEARTWCPVKYGGQNMFGANEGAYTGEISPVMLLALGCEYVLLGHSERRQILNESDPMINSKLKLALETGLTPILCVGETLEEREAGEAQKTVSRQIRRGLEGVPPSGRLVVAYEPVWAIGTGVTATAADAQQMIQYIRGLIKLEWDLEKSEEIRLLYGGSVKPANIGELMEQNDIDGALVGGASLDPRVFAGIINYK